MKRAGMITWGVLLVVSYAVVVPTLATLLAQAVKAARQIEDYTEDILEHARGIERNTAQALALKETRAVAPTLLSAAGSLRDHTGAIAAALANQGDGALPGEEVAS